VENCAIGWTANNNGTGGPTVTTSTLTQTDGGNGEARSAFYNTAQPIAQFSTVFTYQATQPGGQSLADGVSFTLQNQGLSALGSEGSGLGVAGITPSAEVVFNVFNGHTIGTNFTTNGSNPGNTYLATGAVDISSGDPIKVSLSYDGSTLSETLTDLKSSATFNTSYTTDLASVLGGGTAFVGFTGGTGAGTSVQVISDFAFQSSIPEPSSLVLVGLAAAVLGAVKLRRIRPAA
jgi:hypothetical protein